MILPQFYVDDLIKRALSEDINYIDTTSDYMIPADQRSQVHLAAKAEGVLCGIEVAMRVFELLDGSFSYQLHKEEGDRLQAGDVIAVMTGKTRELLKAERTALNLLQHMSGVATATAQAVAIVEGTNASIVDTRKTLPGLRPLQKYNLSDGAMLKDNHIDAAGGITAAIQTLRPKVGHMVNIEVETRNLDEVQEALDAGADIIMLDNMDCETMRKAVEMTGGKALLEASGGITSDTLRSVAETGVDIISIGALTHSVKALDISMKFDQ